MQLFYMRVNPKDFLFCWQAVKENVNCVGGYAAR
jgi:hypothetical protein